MIDSPKTARRLRRLLVLAGASALIVLSGCSGSSPAAGTAAYDEAPAKGGAAPEYGAPEEVPAPSEGGPAVLDDRKIIRVATIDLVVTDMAKAAADLRAVAAGVGGTVTAESLSLPEAADLGTSDSMVVVSVPATQLERTLTLIGGIGEVRNRTIESTDVTDTVVDTESRVATMRESIARLQELMSKAWSISEIAKVESELTSRQAELEALLAKLTTLNRQVDLSPITVTLHTPDTVEPVPLAGFLPGLQAGWESLMTVAGVVLTALGVILPYLAVAAVIAVPLLLWRRSRQTRSGAAATPGTQNTPDGGKDTPGAA
ncbi:MAG: DUF4349 domain-containing protein [Propionicimonas sp.]|nr:DUF4349 domain-containing protein [Propionicimonas sp.]